MAGVHGTVSHCVQTRTREIGIRIALGSSPFDVLRFVVGRALLWSLIGAAIGALGAIGLVGLIQTQLFGMDGRELWAYSLPFTIVTAMAVVAAYPVARRAAKLDPIEILRKG